MNKTKTLTFGLALITFASASMSYASGGKKPYELTCGIQEGTQALQAVTRGNVFDSIITLSGTAAFGSYEVRAGRRHVVASVQESRTKQVSNFQGEIELHGNASEHGPSQFFVTVQSTESGVLPVRLACQAKKLN